MNDQCLNCRIRKSCYYKEPEEDWTCEHYGYFNDQISEKLSESEKVIGESLRILNDIKFAMKRDAKKEVDEAYQRGLDDAWEAAKKLSWTEKYGGYGECLDKVFDRTDTFDFLEYSPNEAIEKLKAYEEEQKADDDIKVGDEVRLCRHKVPYIVTSCDGDDGTYILMTVNGGFIKAEKLNVRKTGRHFDIEKVLEAMKA